MRKLMFFVVVAAIFCSGTATTHESTPSPTDQTSREANTQLSARELAFVAGQLPIDDNTLALINEHLAHKLAAGKKRITVLSELRDTFQNASGQKLSASDWALIIAGSAVFAASIYFFVKWALASPRTETTPPPQVDLATPVDGNDEWVTIPLDSPAHTNPALRPTFPGIDLEKDLDLDDRPKKKRTRPSRTGAGSHKTH